MSVFVVMMVKRLSNWLVLLHFDNLIVLTDACDESFRWTPYVRHSDRAFGQHNHPAPLDRHRYVFFHQLVLNNTSAVNVADSLVQKPALNEINTFRNRIFICSIENRFRFELTIVRAVAAGTSHMHALSIG